MEITLGNTFFMSKEHLKKYLVSLLHRGFAISSNESLVIQDLFKMHPLYEEKIGTDKVVGAGIVSSGKFMSPCFCVYTNKQKRITFSWKSCFSSKRVAVNKRIHEAFRNSIAKFCTEYYNKFVNSDSVKNGKFKCELTGKWFDMIDITVDHVVPFQTLIADWSTKNSINIETISVHNVKKDKSGYFVFDDKSVEQSFQDYHEKYGNLICIPYELNIKLGSLSKDSVEAKEIIKKFGETNGTMEAC